MKSITLNLRHLYTFARMKFSFGERLFNSEYITIGLEPDKRFNPVCSRCQSGATGIHSYHERTVRDLPLGPFRKVWLSFRYRKVECAACGRFTVEELSVAEPGGPRVTKRFAQYIYSMCKLMPVKHVADWLELDWKTV